jgi:hypothetical protein
MVNVGDTVLTQFNASFGFQLNPFAQPTSDLQTRLQTVGFKVLKIDATALSAVETGITLGASGGGTVLVSVQPVSSAYGSEQDVASVVAGAAYAVGFDVDFSTVTGSIVGYSNPALGQSSSSQYQSLQNQSDSVQRSDWLDELAKTLGMSKTTLEVGAGLLAVVVVVAMFRR